MHKQNIPQLSTRLTLQPNKLFISKFMEVLENNRDQFAIQSANEKMSYQELNTATDITATYLRGLGLQTHDRMLIIADRNPNLIILIVAAYKIGVTISLVDHTYPIDYINTCIEILQPQICINLNQEFQVNLLQKFIFIKNYLNFFTVPTLTAGGVVTKFCTDVFEFNDTAIITFTSGTSGKPKAVLGRYGSLTQFYPWMNEKFGPFSSDRFGLCSNLGHDPLQRDIFTPLYFGATIVIPDKQDIFAPGMFPHWLKIQGITVCCLTPAMCKFITTFKDEEFAVATLRLIFFVGSNLTVNQISELKRVANKARVINLYGSTETQRAVSYFEIPEALDNLPDIIPIGHGMSGVELIILKENSFEACAVGDIGEIVVRSPYISKGYLNALTENTEKFVKNPFTSDARDIMYRTGDLGFYDVNSSFGVRCIGRIDKQVKINGHRVELEHITNICLSWPDVTDCVTSVSQEDEHIQLICYVVISKLEVDKLTDYLKSKIPAYMIPHKFITLQAIPLTHNGKVDYQELMEIYKRSHINTEDMQNYQTSSTLQLLVNKIKVMLNVDAVDINEPLYVYGLNSIRSIEFFSFIRSQFITALPYSNISLLNAASIARYITTNSDYICNDVYESKVMTEPKLDLLQKYGAVKNISETSIEFDEHKFEHYCSNSYLALSSHVELRNAVKEFLSQDSSLGSHGSFELNGFTYYHDGIINHLKTIYNCDQVMLYGSTYMANISVIPEIADRSSDIFIDESCHKSILDGCFLAGSVSYIYKHNCMQSLEDKLKSSKNTNKIIVTEGVFSMEGDILDLPGVKSLANKYGALLLVDEACALGQIGNRGFGVEDYYNLPNSIDIRVGTLSKAIPSIGGYAAISNELYKKIRYKRGGFLSGSIPMLQAMIAQKSLEILIHDNKLTCKQQQNAYEWRTGLQKLGFNVGATQTGIIPIYSDGAITIHQIYDQLIADNIYVLPVFYPWVGSTDREVIRTSITAAHSREMITRTLARIKEKLQ